MWACYSCGSTSPGCGHREPELMVAWRHGFRLAATPDAGVPELPERKPPARAPAAGARIEAQG
jgi:hypothetical protein